VKALSFLGVSSWEPVTYVWNETSGAPLTYQTHLFPEAVARIFSPDRLLLLVTDKAAEDPKFKELCERLGDLVEPVRIPDGRSTEELWEIFDICVSRVGKDEDLVLDVTHGFRTLPLIVFTVGAYLRRTRNVTIRRIVYGAYEAREPLRNPPEPTDRAPVFDLTPLLDLLDWLSGAEAFLRRSDATILAERLLKTRRSLSGTRPGEVLAKKLDGVGKKLGLLGDALHLARVTDVMRLSGEFLRKMDEAEEDIGRWAKPFGTILDEVRKEIGPIQYYSSSGRLDMENLRRQFSLVEHYEKKGLIMQAVTLARELMVSWGCLKTGAGPDQWRDKDFREKVEKEMNEVARSLRSSSPWHSHPWFTREVAEVWNELSILRNDLAHCGMRKDASTETTIVGNARRVLQKVAKVFD